MAIRNKITKTHYTSKLPLDKIKAQAKSAVAELEKKGLDLRTPFFLELEYNEAIPFVAIGESSDLAKIFTKEKTSDAFAEGQIFLSKSGTKKIAYFEYEKGKGKGNASSKDVKAALKNYIKKWIAWDCELVEPSTPPKNTVPKNDQPKKMEEVPHKVQEAPKKVSPIQEMVDDLTDYKRRYELLDLSEHEIKDLKSLYQDLDQWQKKYKTLEEDKQKRIEGVATAIEVLMKKTLNMIKVDKVLEKEIDGIIANLTTYMDDPLNGEKLKKAMLVDIEKARNLAERLVATDITAQLDELEALLSIELA